MSTRPVLKPQAVIVAGDMSGDVTSDPTILNQLSAVSYQARWAGTTPVGTLSIEFSNDYSLLPNGQVNNTGTWTTATIQYQGLPVTSIPVSGNTGDAVIDITVTALYACRLVFTYSSGVGSLDAIVMGRVQ